MFKLTRSSGIPLVIALVCILAWTPALHGQCTTDCGDANADGTINPTDYTEMLQWIFGETPLTGSLDCADLDGYQGVTILDAVALRDCMNRCGSSPQIYFQCPATGDPLVPPPSTDYSVIYNDVFPAGASTVTLQIALVYSTELPLGLTLPLLVKVGGEVPVLGPVETGPDDFWAYHVALTDVAGAPPGHLLLGYTQFHDGSTPTVSRVIARVPLTMPPSAVDRPISLEWTTLAPDNVAIVVRCCWDGVAPALFGCPISLTGDANADGVITSADILYAANVALKGWFPPEPCEAVLDVNCSGSITAADVIYLVNYVFKGGDPPCNVCLLVEDGTWSCP